MHKLHQEKTAFITHHEIFFYKVMPFRLNNVGAIYQCMITKMFKSLIGKNDMVVKSKEKLAHLKDVAEVFKILKRVQVEIEHY